MQQPIPTQQFSLCRADTAPLETLGQQNEEIIMNRPTCVVLFAASTLACATASALQLDGKLPLYPGGHNMNDMPSSAVAMGVPMVLETGDSVHTVDLWYTTNAPKSCTRSAQSSGVKYQCPGGSIMIYAHGKTQIALVPAFP